MATQRRKPTPPEPEAPPRLRVPVEQLRAHLEDRIARGEALLTGPVNNLANLEARQAAFDSWYDYNRTLLERSFDSQKIANEYRTTFGHWPRDRPVNQRWEWLQEDISNDLRELRSLRDRLGLYELHPDAEAQTKQLKAAAGTEIFIVHGHDGGTKETVARFLTKLVGRQPIILHELPDRGRTIIEKFEDHAVEAACAVVLLTADDIGGAVNGVQRQRARQNVVLELGYFIGRLGRNHVVILNEPDIELPSDINGILYIELDKNDGWRLAVARELRAIGIEADLNNVF